MDDLILPQSHQTRGWGRALAAHGSGSQFSEASPATGAVWGRGFRGKPPRRARGETATWHIEADASFLINSVFKKTTADLVSEATRAVRGYHPGKCRAAPHHALVCLADSLCIAGALQRRSPIVTHCALPQTTAATAFPPEPMLRPRQVLGVLALPQ